MRFPTITGAFKGEASATSKPSELSPQEQTLALMTLAARGVVVRDNDKAGLMKGMGRELHGNSF